MKENNERPVTVPTEQEAAYEAVESDSKGFKPQGSVVPDSNSNASQSDSQNSGATGYSGISTGAESDSPQAHSLEELPVTESVELDGGDMKKGIKEKGEFKRGQIVSHSELISCGHSFGNLKINRTINKSALRKKEISIKKYGLVSPCLVVRAKDCLKAGLEIQFENGDPITSDTKNLYMILIIIDGGHRHEAVGNINSSLKKGENKIECYYYSPLTSDFKVVDLLREANVVTKPWAGSDFLTSLIMSREEAANNEMLLWVQSKLEKLGDTAAWEWAKMNRTVPTKSKLAKAAILKDKSDAIFKDISNSSKFERGRSIYEAFERIFSTKILGCKFFPEWVIDKLAELVETMNEQEAAEQIIVFASKICREDAEKLESIKGSDKAQIVKDELSSLYAKRMM